MSLFLSFRSEKFPVQLHQFYSQCSAHLLTSVDLQCLLSLSTVCRLAFQEAGLLSYFDTFFFVSNP